MYVCMDGWMYVNMYVCISSSLNEYKDAIQNHVYIYIHIQFILFFRDQIKLVCSKKIF